jgi:3-oxoacyl-[acyl-carrier protein] reductase
MNDPATPKIDARALAGRVAVVTGGASGIGEATVRALAAEGCRVGIVDLDAARAQALAAATGGLAVIADVSRSERFDQALDQVEAALGPLDILVNNAGINGGANMRRVRPRIEQQMDEVGRTGRPATTPLDATVDMTDAEWAEMLAVNLSSVFYGTRRAIRSMQARGRGVIVNVASLCGMQGCPGFPHYSAAKAGVLGFTRAVAKEVAQLGIRVNAVAPGFIDTPFQDQAGQRLLATIALQVPQGRLGQAAEVAGAIVFLCRDESAYMIGQTLSPNGGVLTV